MRCCLSVITALVLFSVLPPSAVLGQATQALSGEEITRETVFSVSGKLDVPLDIPAGVVFDLTIDDISTEVDVSIRAGANLVFQRTVSSVSGIIEAGPEPVALGPGEYTISERYSGKLSFSDPLFGIPFAVLQSVEVSRKLSVTHATDYTLAIQAHLEDLRPHVAQGPFAVLGDFPDVVHGDIPLTLKVTEPIEAGDEVAFKLDFRMKIVSKTRLHAPETPRIFVDVIQEDSEEVVAEVRVADITDLFGFQFDLQFDWRLLKVTQIDEGEFLKRGGAETFWRPPTIKNRTRQLSNVLGTRLTPGGVSGDGTLARVSFAVRKAGVSLLELSNVKLLDATGHQIDTRVESGNVNTTLPISATLRVVPQLIDEFVVAEVQIDDAVNVKRFSVDLAFPPGLEPIGVRSKKLRGTVIREITQASVFKFHIYEGGELRFVLQNGTLTGDSGRKAVPKLEHGLITAVASPAWDVNRDYKINLFDIGPLGSEFGEHIPADSRPNPDVTRDRIVDIFDFVQIGLHFGEVYSPVPGVAAAPAIAIEAWRTESMDVSQQRFLQQMAVELTRHPLADTPAFMKARALLAELMASAVEVPRQTRLLPNFPNPFNPETWIPYELHDAAPITIQIYDATGALIRTLDLGQRAAGFYRTRDDAAYWDGRNDAGESVVSGIYFYQLHAGSDSITRRMLVLK